MKLAVSSLLVCLILCMNYSQAFPSSRCQCIETSSKFIPVRQLKTIEMFPKSSHCNQVEVIAVVKTSVEKICLNPTVPWVRALISKALKKSQKPS